MDLKFRALTADEIDVRVNVDAENSYVTLLLYKDARVDMDILDETVGSTSWQRAHSRDNANCTVSIWDEDKKQWVSKEDTGTESITEKEKGLASDSFKRACTNWGIGRELYTAPFIMVTDDEGEIRRKKHPKTGKMVCATKFFVSSVTISEAKKITALTIVNDRGKTVFEMGAPKQKQKPKQAPTFKAAAPKGAEPEEKPEPPKMTVVQMVETIKRLYSPEQQATLAKNHAVASVEDITEDELSALMGRLRKAGKI